jgi:hypothetical protein
MKLELEVLDGPQKGKKISLKTGLQIGQKTPFDFADKQMSQMHSVLSFDNKNSWNIECLATLKLRVGADEVGRANLIKGLIFHLGQTGFKVVEKPKLAYESWDEAIKDWLTNNPASPAPSEIFFFLNAIRLTFIQGSQFEEYFTLSYGPRVIGHNNIDLNLKDPSAPHRVAKFFQVGAQSYVENMCGDRAKINGAPFDQHRIQNGDRLTVASNVIELSVLK